MTDFAGSAPVQDRISRAAVVMVRRNAKTRYAVR